jgi:hypothetical protein
LPHYPIEPDKLLDVADRLAPARPGPGRPAYAAHRRAVSTAYYAVFHAITGRVAETVFPDTDPAFRERVRRWVNHGDIRVVAQWVSQLQGTARGSPPPHITALLAPPGRPALVDAGTILIADGFLELNDKRELADYDHQAVFTRPDTRGHIALARSVVTATERADSASAKCLFGLVAMQAKILAR